MLDIKVIFYENRFENSFTDNKIQNSYKYSSIYYISEHTYINTYMEMNIQIIYCKLLKNCFETIKA